MFLTRCVEFWRQNYIAGCKIPKSLMKLGQVLLRFTPESVLMYWVIGSRKNMNAVGGSLLDVFPGKRGKSILLYSR